jgi:hypothetical protein
MKSNKSFDQYLKFLVNAGTSSGIGKTLMTGYEGALELRVRGSLSLKQSRISRGQGYAPG